MHAPHTTATGLVAALAALAAVLAGCTDTAKSGLASPRSGDATSPSPTSSTSSTGDADARTQTPSGATIITEIADSALERGRYALPPIGRLHEPFAVVSLPSGYSNWGNFIYANEPVENDDPLEFALWDINGVYMNPCAMSDEVSTRSVDAIADALVRQPLTSASRPRGVTLAGYHGLYMEVTTPTGFNYSKCDDAELNLWEGRPDGGYWTWMPGMVERLWILDVDGRTMVIHLAVPPSATDPQIRAMTDIIEAATFETPEA